MNYDDFEVIRPEIYISDIEDCKYKYDILELYKAGIFNLYSDGTFKPNNYMKRSEFAVITVRVAEALSIDLSKFDTLPLESYKLFPDWYMNILTKMGIYKPDKSGEVYPDECLTQNYLTQKYIQLLNDINEQSY